MDLRKREHSSTGLGESSSDYDDSNVDPNFDVDKEKIDSDDSRRSNSQNESSSDSESNIPLNVWRKINEAMEYRKTLKETDKLHQKRGSSRVEDEKGRLKRK